MATHTTTPQVDQAVVAHVTLQSARGAWHEFSTRCLLQESDKVAVEGTALALMPSQ